MYQYKVFIIDPAPGEAEGVLNVLAAQGWRVVAVAHEDRVLMERPIPGSGYDAPKKPKILLRNTAFRKIAQ